MGFTDKKTAPFRSELKRGGRAVEAVVKSGLPKLLETVDPGVFGTTKSNILLLEEISAALELTLEARDQMVYMFSKSSGDGVELEPLKEEENRLAGLFAIKVFCDTLSRRLADITEPTSIEGKLSNEGLLELAEEQGEKLLARMTRLLFLFLERERNGQWGLKRDADAMEAVYAFAVLLQRTVDAISSTGRLGKLKENLKDRSFKLKNSSWRGFESEDEGVVSHRLREVTTSQIVGNKDYLEAGLRLARDIAGFDFTAKKNPKKLNPILFGLGPPGCGKTLVAHAVGNYFLSYCKKRNIPARFAVVRRSDWASSYQNASAANLIRIFKEHYEFEGVCGIYWADIDTALASRDQQGLRAEEKANLSAAFSIFDETLIPFDGKWFMICDANNLNMDSALKTRIARNPFKVEGPKTTEDYVRLLKDILLFDYHEKISVDEKQWTKIGAIAGKAKISGRGIESISRQVVNRIQEFEYPDAYYEADFEERKKILAKLSKKIYANNLEEIVTHYIRFESDEEARLAKAKFDAAVKEAVFALNVHNETISRFSTESPFEGE